eukprot:TRINITY_DN3385_c0_g1_i2.p1 TRINITY_DN3385_c0_g1~~TRINITY_DN3385_c0_g1_i2.p1  ORF type:complete len:175 (-),score=37.39 TRINITY_DN3385_c0_g1_i2:95-619(-)
MSSSLLVVSKSTIPNGGVGLFAKEDIPKGTKLWVFDTDTNLFFTKPQYLHISDIFLLPADEQHGLNGVSHSTVAAHDIKKGEEVFEDYSTFDVCPWCPNNLATWQFIHLTEEQKKASISKVKEKDVALTPIVVSKRQMEVFKSSHMDKCAKEGMMKWIETQGRWNEEKQSWLLL